MQPVARKSRNLKTYFIFLAIANIVTIVFPLLIINWAIQQAKSGVSGTEFIGVILVPLQLLGIGVAVLNVVTISVYLYNRRPRKIITAFGAAVVIASALYVGTIAVVAIKNIQLNSRPDRPLSKQEAP